MFTGRGGRFGSTPGLFVGMGFWRTEYSSISNCAIYHTSMIIAQKYTQILYN